MKLIKKIYHFVLERLKEQSTWQGLGFVAGFFGAHSLASMDTGAAAAFGGFVSAFLKTIIPDDLGKKDPQ